MWKAAMRETSIRSIRLIKAAREKTAIREAYQPTKDPRAVLAEHAGRRALAELQLDQAIESADRCSKAVTDRIAALRARRPEEGTVPLIPDVDRIAALRARRPEEGTVPLIAPEKGRDTKYDDWVQNRLAMLPGRPRIEARQSATINGDRTYIGGRHEICGTSLRYTKGSACVRCAKQASKLERERRDAADVLSLSLMKAERAARQKTHDDWVRKEKIERAAHEDFLRAEARARVQTYELERTRAKAEKAEKALLAQAMKRQLKTALKLAETAVKVQHKADIARAWEQIKSTDASVGA